MLLSNSKYQLHVDVESHEQRHRAPRREIARSPRGYDALAPVRGVRVLIAEGGKSRVADSLSYLAFGKYDVRMS